MERAPIAHSVRDPAGAGQLLALAAARQAVDRVDAADRHAPECMPPLRSPTIEHYFGPTGT
jgi:hypothetical protein